MYAVAAGTGLQHPGASQHPHEPEEGDVDGVVQQLRQRGEQDEEVEHVQPAGVAEEEIRPLAQDVRHHLDGQPNEEADLGAGPCEHGWGAR